MPDREESFISIQTIDQSLRSRQQDTSLNIYMPLISAVGPITPTVINSPTELLSNYSLADQLYPTDDTTLLHAAKILQFSPVTVCRVVNTNVLSGITNGDHNVYCDENYNIG